MSEARPGVYPFCGPCSTSSIAWRAPDPAGLVRTRFYGHRDVCPDCGSSVRTLFATVLWIPVARLGRYRIVPTGGRSYVGRMVVDSPVQPQPAGEPVSELGNHPELDSTEYDQAEKLWAEGLPGHALPHYEAALEARERVLRADDPAVLRVRLRVAQGLLATGNYGRSIGWFELLTPQLVEVFGPSHKLTRAATEAVTGARLMVGGSRAEVKLLTNVLTVDEDTHGRLHPQTVRSRAALGRAHVVTAHYSTALALLTATYQDALELQGPDHPDTTVYRAALSDACTTAETNGNRKTTEATTTARRLLETTSL